MGTLFSTLDIARSGMLAAQIQLDVAGNNIANINTPGYSRQRAELAERFAVRTPWGFMGRGVGVSTVRRVRDRFLDEAYLRQAPRLGSTEVQAQYYNLLEDIYLEPGENGFGRRLDRFFNALGDFASNVELLPVREAFLAEAQALAGSLNTLATRFNQLRTNANEEVKNFVPEVNSIAARISDLNAQIRYNEGVGQPANGLRDQRGLLLDQLARLVNISTREDDSGSVHVQIGSDVLIDATGARQIVAVPTSLIDPERPDLVELRFADDNSLVDIQGGEIFGVLTMRDTVIPGQDQRLDQVAAALILQLNRIHSQGNGLTNLSGTLSSTNPVSASTDPLVSAGLPFPVTPGSLDVVVYDAAGNATTTTITIAASTTLDDLAAALSGIPNFSASVSGTTLSFGTTAPFTFSFANDTSGALAALGINGLFNGTDAGTIAVNPDLISNPGWLTSGFSSDVLSTGDNSAALAMLAVRDLAVLDGNTSTIAEFYQSTVARLGVDARANEDTFFAETQFVHTLDARRLEVSGVNLDEEVTSLLIFQRAYEASARLVSVTDRMLETLLSIGQ